MAPNDLESFRNICHRISLNLPASSPWRWDEQFNLALAVIGRKDEIMVELPLAVEFSHQWDFSTISDADAAIRDFFLNGLGLVPGQKVFTMDPVNGVVLFAVWWPWGNDEWISIRLGLLSIAGAPLNPDEAKSLIGRWLKLV